MPRYIRNLAILAKNEAAYAVDAGPAAANVMLMTNVRFEPMVGTDLSRDLLLPYMGHQGVILDGHYTRMTGEVEIAGSGAAGTPPAYGPLLRCCAMREVITAGTDVQYSPVSTGQEAATIHYNADGVRHVMLGVRGTFSLQLKPLTIPRFTFTLTGLMGQITDTPLPAVALNAWKKPLPVNATNTTFSLHGYAGACEGITMDLGNQIEPRFLIGSDSIKQVDRAMTGSAIFEAATLAEKNWFQAAISHTTGPLAAQHGKVAGNIVAFDAPAVQPGRVTEGETQKIRNNTIPLFYTPVAGNDEFKITVK